MSDLQRERDLVLNPNEYAYVLDKTKGLISCVVGSSKMSLSNSDALVVFNEETKKFEEANFDTAITTFVAVPENWYVALKNPTVDGSYPAPNSPNTTPKLQIGKKVNIKGNISFALYPGQMAKVIQGHRLHSNQYLLARVYDADALADADLPKTQGVEDKNEKADFSNNTDKSAKDNTSLDSSIVGADSVGYTVGQILVIKGTDVPFYIPPTGIEVIPIGGKGDKYVRDAVTLERLEYCILKNEQGEKKYIHGSAVVFPEPDEVFVKNTATGGYKFKAIELSEISGIYLKVIADYIDDHTGKSYKTGEELFITGKDQMIYYPRAEHSIIKYEDKVLHHAIAIPAGEGRYVLDRMNGNVKMVKGPAMYLPDPRNEVVVKRKLTDKQCRLWFPDNEKALEYNRSLGNSMKSANRVKQSSFDRFSNYSDQPLDNGFYGQENAVVEESGFSRGNTYSEPRTILIDNKYAGVVSIDIFTGYAVNLISKDGIRKVVCGPQTCLLEYDQTLEVLELSTGKPKTTDELLKTVYLRVSNNKIADIIHVQTKDFVDVDIKVSYCVDFLERFKSKWFDVENYVKYLCDRQRSLLKREVKQHNIEDFYQNASDIVRRVALGIPESGVVTNLECGKVGMLFNENGMFVHDVDVLSIRVEDSIQDMIDQHQHTMVRRQLEWSSKKREVEILEQMIKAEEREAELEYDTKQHELELEKELDTARIAKQEAIKRLEEAATKTAKETEKSLQPVLDAIQEAKLTREKKSQDAEIAYKEALAELEVSKRESVTEAIRDVMKAISPDLIASMTATSNAELLKTLAEAMSPYALAENSGESVVDVTTRLLHGTSLEEFVGKLPSIVAPSLEENED